MSVVARSGGEWIVWVVSLVLVASGSGRCIRSRKGTPWRTGEYAQRRHGRIPRILGDSRMRRRLGPRPPPAVAEAAASGRPWGGGRTGLVLPRVVILVVLGVWVQPSP